jgi:phage terminase small subunit
MANHPHNPERPVSKKMRAAIDANDVAAVESLLTPRQLGYAREYVVDFNGTAAAIRAGYAPKNAEQQAHLLKKHEGIAFYVQHLTESKAAKITSVDPDYVIGQVTRIISKDGTKDGDILRACELLARHLGMFIDRTEISGKDGEAIKYQEIEIEADDFTKRLRDLASKRKPNLKVVGE